MRLARSLTVSLAAACLLSLTLAGQALAHKVNVFAYAEGGRVYTQAYFNDGKPAMDSTIEVFCGSAQKPLLSGKTDEQGEFSFPVPAQKGDLKIVLVASMGHKNEYVLPASEISSQAKAKAPEPPAKAEAPKPAAHAEKAAAPAEAAPGAGGLDEARIRAIVNESLDARLLPLTRMVARLGEEHVRFTDVVGGIGYILGLAGVAAYFASRRRRG